MTLYQALDQLEALYDIRYAVLLENQGYPFSTYLVIPSDIRIQYYGLDLGPESAIYEPDIEGLLQYCIGKALFKMPYAMQQSDDWHVFSNEEFLNFNESLWRKPK